MAGTAVRLAQALATIMRDLNQMEMTVGKSPNRTDAPVEREQSADALSNFKEVYEHRIPQDALL